MTSKSEVLAYYRSSLLHFPLKKMPRKLSLRQCSGVIHSSRENADFFVSELISTLFSAPVPGRTFLSRHLPRKWWWTLLHKFARLAQPNPDIDTPGKTFFLKEQTHNYFGAKLVFNTLVGSAVSGFYNWYIKSKSNLVDNFEQISEIRDVSAKWEACIQQMKKKILLPLFGST